MPSSNTCVTLKPRSTILSKESILIPSIILDKEESLLLINALDFYSRIWVGQYDQLDTRTDSMSFLFGDSTAERELTEALLKARSIDFFRLLSYGSSALTLVLLLAS